MFCLGLSEHMFVFSKTNTYTAPNEDGRPFMDRKKLTARQDQIYQFICKEVDEKGYPPSVREIAEAVGLSSPSTVHTHLQILEDKGYIRRDLSKPRALEIIDDAIGDAPAAADGSVRGIVSLPLVGKVAAGTPILAEQNIESMISLPESLVGDSASFVLRVQGESMINAGIFSGDYVVVRQQGQADNGQIVVAMVDDGATVKTFYREDGRIRLQPENPTMDPIYVTDPKILGRVVALVRSL